MIHNLKYYLLFLVLVNLISCGEPPTSQLTEQFPITRPGLHDMEFALIPSGTFRMGSLKDEKGRSDEEDPHWVKITEDYWMQTTEVTRGQWHKVMGSYPDNRDNCVGQHSGTDEDNHPVVCVNWDDTKDYIMKLNVLEKSRGYEYALPTEAQWEYAARGYTESPYSEGDSLISVWNRKNSNELIHPAKSLKPNFFGLYGVHGNVWEWVSDWYEQHYPKADSFFEAIINPQGPAYGDTRIIRGGGWYSSDYQCRSASRSGITGMSGGIGFRLMRVER